VNEVAAAARNRFTSVLWMFAVREEHSAGMAVTHRTNLSAIFQHFQWEVRVSVSGRKIVIATGLMNAGPMANAL
jgi:hypothetical protein